LHDMLFPVLVDVPALVIVPICDVENMA
jgi:hypothetical protein